MYIRFLKKNSFLIRINNILGAFKDSLQFSVGLSRENNSDNALMQLIKAQRIEGNWDSQSGILEQLGLKTQTVASLKPQQVPDGDIWLTLFILLFLKAFFTAQALKWTLIAKKALTWLENHGQNVNHYSHLLSNVQAIEWQ